jgi:hypothetical protein
VAADFKSHVLLRDEKGVFGIPFKRLLLAGVGGGLTYTVFNLALREWSIPVAAVTGIAIIVLTGLRGGIPLWNRLVYRWRGTLLLLAVRFPHSPIGRLTEALELPSDLVRLDGARVFAPPAGAVEIDLREWITFAHAGEQDGLVFVDAPLRADRLDQLTPPAEEARI